MSHHSSEEEQALRSLSTKDLAKKNNRHVNGGLIYETVEKKEKHDEEFDIIRDELTQRGILENSSVKRLIDGSELV